MDLNQPGEHQSCNVQPQRSIVRSMAYGKASISSNDDKAQLALLG